MKRIISIVLILAILLSLNTNIVLANAADDIDTFDIPIITVDRDLSDAQINLLLAASPYKRDIGGITIGVVRSGNTTRCSVHLNWAATTLVGGLRFKYIYISNGSILNYIEYKKFGDGIDYLTYSVVASKTGSTTIGFATIPVDVDRVKAISVSLQAYVLSSASWVSSTELSGFVDVD